MLFKSPDEFVSAPRHAVTVFGMAGVGKTRLAALLRESHWFHYSADYRIGTRHMGEFITDNFKAEAMKVPFLRDLLRTDSIKLSSAITFENLAPLSTYLGRPGSKTKGGLELDEYRRWQEQHRVAEVAALQELPYFIERAHDLYEHHGVAIRRAMAAGVKVVAGTDAGGHGHPANAGELPLLVKAGMTPMQALQAATSWAAECLGWEDRIGTVEKGKLADVILVNGDPLADMALLTDPAKIALVIKDGAIAADRMSSR